MNCKHIDHIDHDSKNNIKFNLRPVDHINNATNRKSKNINNKTGYRNVCLVDGKYIVQLQIEGRNTRLGSFDDVHKAGALAKKMRERYYGEFAGDN